MRGDKIRVQGFAIGAFQVNQFIVIDESSRTFGVIEAPGPNTSLDSLVTDGYSALWITLTHGHIDHIAGLKTLQQSLNCPVYMHKSDLYLFRHVAGNPYQALLQAEEPPDPDGFLTEGDTLELGTCRFQVIHTPGHTPGGICLYDGGHHLFTGDTLFYESIGRTDLPGGDHGTLLTSIRRRLLALPDEVCVHPGHGPDSTIGHERTRNPFIM